MNGNYLMVRMHIVGNNGYRTMMVMNKLIKVMSRQKMVTSKQRMVMSKQRMAMNKQMTVMRRKMKAMSRRLRVMNMSLNAIQMLAMYTTKTVHRMLSKGIGCKWPNYKPPMKMKDCCKGLMMSTPKTTVNYRNLKTVNCTPTKSYGSGNCN